MKIKILGVKVNNISMPETLRMLESFIISRNPHQIVTTNPEIIMNAQKDVKAKQIINDSDLSLPDGAGLLWAAKFTGQKLSNRVAGVDLIYKLCQLCQNKRYSIYLLGGIPGIAKKTAEKLNQLYPQLKIVGYSCADPALNNNQSSKFKFPYNLRTTDIKMTKIDQNLKIVKEIRHAKPDVLLVAYGHPKQELFISRYKNVLNVPVMIGVGGSFDFIAGLTKRAPKIFQKLGFDLLGFEWLWRFFTQPWRIKRIFTAVIIFPWKVFIDKITYKN